MRGWMMVVPLLGLLGLVLWGSWQLWHQLEGVVIGPHGQIALALGGGLALLMTLLFMVLIYVSHTRGYDDRAGSEEDDVGGEER